jgi:gamma-glutamylcyclotransferase (GGCT)/AIG2-like uncharacterized protein YtfP
MHLFIYGTLLDLGLLSRLLGRPAMVQPAVLEGWRRVRLRGTPYPTLVPARDEVWGGLIFADAPALRRLHRYEGPRYRLVPVRPRVTGSRAVTPAYAWIAKGATIRVWP